MIINLSPVELCLAVLFFLIAFVVYLKVLTKFVQIFWVYWLSYYYGSGVKWCGGPNTWAVITGATDGIGLKYAEAMAEKGYNLFLMSRNSLKLNEVKRKIEENHINCNEIKTLSVDFTKTDIYGLIEEELKKLEEIHVLINNVGITNEYPEYFTKKEDSAQFLSDIINVNILAMTRLIDIVLPQMETKKRGIIINLSSICALYPTPLLSVYSATKLYADQLSRSLNAEFAHKGIIIQSVLPYWVSTNMIKNPRTSSLIPSADTFVKSAIKTVGLENRTHGYFPHSIFAFFINDFLKFFVGENFIIKLNLWTLKGKRDRYFERKLELSKKIE